MITTAKLCVTYNSMDFENGSRIHHRHLANSVGTIKHIEVPEATNGPDDILITVVWDHLSGLYIYILSDLTLAEPLMSADNPNTTFKRRI